MANKILIGSNISSPIYEFTNANIKTCSVVLSSSLSGDELSIDQFMPVVYSGGIATHVPFAPQGKRFLLSSDGKLFSVVGDKRKYPDSIPYGTPIWYYNNETLIGKFYTQQIMRSGMNRYDILSVSAVGIMDGSKHYGGLYNGQTFAQVAADIIGNEFSFTCTDEVANVLIFGWLPIAAKRENLHQLLFATGVALYKDDDGEILFRFPEDGNVKNIPNNRVFYGGSIDYRVPATRAEVTEHSFRTSDHDETVTLFDNMNGETADHTFVSFQNAPIYDLVVTGTLEIHESNVNYAILSGVGTLVGKKYTHITRVLSAENNRNNATEKTVSVTDATLVSTANSENVLNRVLSFYSSARTIQNDIVLENEQAGDQVSFENPYGEQEQAFIASLDINVSSFLRASCEMVTGYLPSGGGNNYTKFVLLTGSGTWEIPAEVFQKDKPSIRAILVGGGNGGQSGANGGNGGGGGTSDPSSIGSAGEGGEAGIGGDGGNIFSVNIDCSGMVSIDYDCGLGGAGGIGGSGNANGDIGSATTFGDYTSAAGIPSAVGVANIFTGAVFGQAGVPGVKGGKGGTYQTEAESVTFNGITYDGGAFGSNTQYGYGGAGGGAAVGSDGGNGGSGISTSSDYGTGGSGGAGGSAISRTAKTAYGSGGDGGHGGGGGGGGGSAKNWPGSGGSGGRGGDGGNAANGCILIYY